MGHQKTPDLPAFLNAYCGRAERHCEWFNFFLASSDFVLTKDLSANLMSQRFYLGANAWMHVLRELSVWQQANIFVC